MDSKNRRIDKDLGAFIRYCYFKYGKSLDRFAEEIKVEPRTINYYFNGQRKPSQRTLLNILKVSNVNFKDIPDFD